MMIMIIIIIIVLSDTPHNYESKWKETTSSKSQGKKSKV